MSSKQPYTDPYLQERVSKVIQAQKKGKILVAAYKDGTGLPTREDLSDLRYAANLHPHSYIVGNSGYLDYESDLGMYSFFPKGNQTLPAVLRNQTPLVLGEAVINLATRTAEIQVGDTLITFTGVPVWSAGNQIVTELNEELSRKNTGVIVWKITYQESKAPVDRLYPGAVPTLVNAHTLGHLSGYAFDRENYLIYAGVTGYKTSLESHYAPRSLPTSRSTWNTPTSTPTRCFCHSNVTNIYFTLCPNTPAITLPLWPVRPSLASGNRRIYTPMCSFFEARWIHRQLRK